MQNTVFYAVKTSDGMWQFSRTINPNPQVLNEEEFKQRKLEENPMGREVRIFPSEELWRKAQSL